MFIAPFASNNECTVSAWGNPDENDKIFPIYIYLMCLGTHCSIWKTHSHAKQPGKYMLIETVDRNICW